MLEQDKKQLTDQYLEFIQTPVSQIQEIDKVYNDIIEVINYNNQLYYINSTPIISDYQYDQLFSYLKKLEEYYPEIIKDYSPTQKLTFQVQKEFKQAPHKTPMLSLENTYNAQDLRDWDEFIQRQLKKSELDLSLEYLIEPKFDGVSIELIYKDNQFKQAITRGDWFVWEDVTENIKTIKSVPKKLNFSSVVPNVRIRWEIVMPKSKLEEINIERQKQGLSLFANTRNAASWSIRQLDPNVTASRGLEFYWYEILFDGLPEPIVDFEKLGFKVFNIASSKSSIEEIIWFCEDPKIQEELESKDIEFDGLVIKIKDLDIRQKIWSTAHHPRWAVAYKFPAKQIVTKLIWVNFSLWRTWILTPVAKLETVNIRWVNVSSASLHNFDFILQKDIRVGDYVWVQRSGEVIPYVLGPVIEKRWETTQILPPDACPVCKTATVRFEDEPFYYCPNINCEWIIKERLVHFVSKDCMDIDGFGDKFIELFVDCWFVKHFADIYKLSNPSTRFQLKSLPLMGEKRINDLLQNIEKSKNNFLWRVINAIWVRHIWKKTAKVLEEEIFKLIENWELKVENEELAENLDDNKPVRLTKKMIQEIWYKEFLKNIQWITIDKFWVDQLVTILTNDYFLKSVYGIGTETIDSLKVYLTNEENIKILKELESQWLKFNNFGLSTKNNSNNPLEWVHFSVTWKFDISRTQIVKVLEEVGAVWDEEPLKTTNFMLVGADSGSKLKKAQDYWIEIINWILELECKYIFLKGKFQGWTKNNWIQINSLF